MKTYTVCGQYPLKKKKGEKVESLHERKLFQPLTALETSLKGQLTVLNKMAIVGVAIVEASDEAVETMKKAGFIVELNQRRKLIW